ncbi:MAG: hypothetical protein QM608_01590 [Caulobacter sp.]
MKTLSLDLWIRTSRVYDAASDISWSPELADFDDRLAIGGHSAVRLAAARRP